MKNLLKLFFFFISFTVFSQSGTITYDIQIGIDLTLVPKDKVDFFTEIVNYAKEDQFVLSFNSTKSSFIRKKKLNNDSDYDSKIKDIARGTYTSSSDLYIDIFQKLEVSKESDGTLVENKNDTTSWEVSTDSKNIGNYVCYKAVKKIPFVSRRGGLKVREVLAWFAPSLPYSYGPMNFYGLPGLILELTDNKTTYLATRIDLVKQEIEIGFPNGKTIAKEEFDKKLKAQMGM
jgi:GLPGLI family protein